MYCIRETAGSLCDRRRKPSDEYSGTADDQAESSSDKTFCNQQSGISFHSTDSAELFGEPLVGVGQESGDLSFPDLQKLIPAYGFPYRCIHSSEKLSDTIKEVLEMDGAAVCEVFVTRYQKTEPKTSSKKLPDGKMVSAPLEDMYPFLSREELEENMYIPLPEQK